MQKGNFSKHVSWVHNTNVHLNMFLQQLIKDQLADNDVTSDYEI